ncbi:unnamed protein product [Trifolium pratense]|uniref:Uncharacterized protein n=1 Tax=Trifolium pratense TaxID=57577 RepID=A0ACB0M343_TRIPR|nr:unnamed protein product [Trifolium pratense]
MGNQPKTAIIGPQYCAPATHPVDLIITRDISLRDNFTIKDINKNVVFKVKSPLATILTPRQHRFLYDANRNLILHLQESLLVKDSWKAFRGESIEPKHLIFRKKRSSLLQLKTKLNVFSASNNTGVCDFTVKGSFFGLSWKVYSGNSNIVVAKIIKLGGIFSREKFIVNICPNIDCAFIVALIVSLPK